MKHIGTQIKNMRKHLKMTQQELADSCEIGINTLRTIESGEGNPTMAVMKRILDTLIIAALSVLALSCQEEFGGNVDILTTVLYAAYH